MVNGGQEVEIGFSDYTNTACLMCMHRITVSPPHMPKIDHWSRTKED